MSKKWRTFTEWLISQQHRQDEVGLVSGCWNHRAQSFEFPSWWTDTKDQEWLNQAGEKAREEWSRAYYGTIRDYVYLIQGGEFIKIGISRDPDSRVVELQTGNPNKLQLIAMFMADRFLEARLHEKFAKHRHEGEWFDAEPVLAWLSEVLR